MVRRVFKPSFTSVSSAQSTTGLMGSMLLWGNPTHAKAAQVRQMSHPGATRPVLVKARQRPEHQTSMGSTSCAAQEFSNSQRPS
jgi:hypothetical protein